MVDGKLLLAQPELDAVECLTVSNGCSEIVKISQQLFLGMGLWKLKKRC